MQGTQQHTSTTLLNSESSSLIDSLASSYMGGWSDCTLSTLLPVTVILLSLLLFLSLAIVYSRSQESVSSTKSLITTLTNVCYSSYSGSSLATEFYAAKAAVAAAAVVVIVTPRTLTLNVFCILTFVQVDNCDQQADKCYYCC